MDTMTHKERFLGALNRKPVDCLPCGDGLWGETTRKYIEQGKLNEGEDHVAHFDMSWRGGGWLNSSADLDFKPVTVEETDETILTLDGNGAKLRHWKHKSGTPEHVGFNVVDRESWEKQIKPHLLKLDRRRIGFECYPLHPQTRRRGEARFRLGRRCAIRTDAPGLRTRRHAHGHGPRPRLGQGHGS